MTLSPMQHEYVTKKEFGKYKSFIGDGFDKLGEQIDAVEADLSKKIVSVKELMMEGFVKMEEYIDKSNEETTKNIITHIDQTKVEIINHINLSKKV